MSSLIIQEAANIFLGDDSPDNSKHRSLQSAKLPTLEELTQQHHGGGAIGAVEVGGLGLKELDSTFKLAGWDPQAMSMFGVGGGRQNFTIRGLLRNKDLTNKAITVRAILNARLVTITPDEFKRGDLLGHDYALKEIFRYQLFYDGSEKYFYDYLTSEWRVDGVDQNAEERAALGIG
ncbi:phage tail protein [Labrys sp. WJW]|uniref:phage major tail tube protein n=1 Tax=Labrys sp. WJW TaxID=1737983 RepID=UPI000834DA81|nr:phage major tail tube protein [Labrys sp. WJW]OCC05272.1 phage tail protein [Labrys sp. WJW]